MKTLKDTIKSWMDLTDPSFMIIAFKVLGQARKIFTVRFASPFSLQMPPLVLFSICMLDSG